MKNFFLLTALFAILFTGISNKASAQDAYIGEIRMVGFNFAPVGWVECNGQILSISQNTALYSLLGTMYGGDGQTTFAVPDLRSRVPVGAGQGTGLSNYTQGSKGGYETVTLTLNHLPAHTHGIAVSTAAGTTSSPDGTYFAHTGNFDKEYANSANASNANMVQSSGGNGAHENRPPYQAVKFIICTQGIYPPRSK